MESQKGWTEIYKEGFISSAIMERLILTLLYRDTSCATW